MTLSLNSPVTILFFPEPWENHLFGLIDKITILVNSCTLTVPGATLSGTGITEEERELLLNFALGYRAFYLTNRNDIPDGAYYVFVGQLVAEMLALCQPEPTGHALETAVEWLLGNLPHLENCSPCIPEAGGWGFWACVPVNIVSVKDVFDNPDIEIPPITPYTEILDPQITETLANALPEFSPMNALIEMCTLLMPAHMSYGERGPAASGDSSAAEEQTILRIPPSSVYTEHSSDDDDKYW
ncbi:hypothetical protein LXA43DRAFT_1064175 [Ganoderma leucocontextum]|nr:hypothetical protein LXA43DRAFT_1064175 [Ganoderma leucocontextum]